MRRKPVLIQFHLLVLSLLLAAAPAFAQSSKSKQGHSKASPPSDSSGSGEQLEAFDDDTPAAEPREAKPKDASKGEPKDASKGEQSSESAEEPDLGLSGAGSSDSQSEAATNSAQIGLDEEPAEGKPDQDAAMLNERLEQVQSKLDEVTQRRKHVGVGGPIAMLAIGGAVATFGGLAALALLSAQDSCKSEPDPYNTFAVADNCDDYGTGAAVAGGFAVGGLVLGITGVVMLTQRTGERRRLTREIRKLESEKEDIVDALSFDLVVNPSSAVATVELVF